MEEMIRQVALLRGMMKGVQENRAMSRGNESREEEEGVSEAEETSNVGEKSEASPEKQREVETAEIGLAERETLVEEESINTPLDDEALQKILEETNDEPQEKEEEVIERDVKLNNTLFYLQSEEVHVPNKKADEFTTAVGEENTPTEKSPPVINKSEGCGYEEEKLEPKKRGNKRRAGRFIYWEQLQPWPEPLKADKPPDLRLRPKENKKVQGTYKNHKKKNGQPWW